MASIIYLRSKIIFVFGSNLRGRHGKGAAKYAASHFGAIEGQAFGLQNNSFAIPTRDKTIRHSLPLSQIRTYVQAFIGFAEQQPMWQFKVTRIGCGNAGYKNEQIAPMFKYAPDNCIFDDKWKEFLPNHTKFFTE